MTTILITDDAAFMRRILGDTLRNAGHTIEEAVDGRDAIEKCSQGSYDLITLDITMPNVDGIGALKAIKKIKPDQKCIMISAMGQQAMVIEAIHEGAADFIVKPFQPDRVLEAIKKVLG